MKTVPDLHDFLDVTRNERTRAVAQLERFDRSTTEIECVFWRCGQYYCCSNNVASPKILPCEVIED